MGGISLGLVFLCGIGYAGVFAKAGCGGLAVAAADTCAVPGVPLWGLAIAKGFCCAVLVAVAAETMIIDF